MMGDFKNLDRALGGMDRVAFDELLAHEEELLAEERRKIWEQAAEELEAECVGGQQIAALYRRWLERAKKPGKIEIHAIGYAVNIGDCEGAEASENYIIKSEDNPAKAGE